MFQLTLRFIVNIVSNITIMLNLHIVIAIEKLQPGVKDSVVADPVLSVHDEDRVGRKTAPHLNNQPTHYCPNCLQHFCLKPADLTSGEAPLDHPKSPGDLGVPDKTNISGNEDAIATSLLQYSPVRHQWDVELLEVGVGVEPVKDGVGRVHRDANHLCVKNWTDSQWGGEGEQN